MKNNILMVCLMLFITIQSFSNHRCDDIRLGPIPGSLTVNPMSNTTAHKFNDQGTVIFSADFRRHYKNCHKAVGVCFSCCNKTIIPNVDVILYLSTKSDTSGSLMEIATSILNSNTSVDNSTSEDCEEEVITSWVDEQINYTIPCEQDTIGFKYLILEIKGIGFDFHNDRKNENPNVEIQLFESIPVNIDNDMGDSLTLNTNITDPYAVYRVTEEIIMNPGFEYNAQPGELYHAYIDKCDGTYTGKKGNNDSYGYMESNSIQESGITDQMELNRHNEISIFPNPNSGHFTLLIPSFENSPHTPQVTVMDIMGRTMYQKTTKDTQLELDLSSQAKGVYFVRVQTGEQMLVEKLVLQ